MNELKTPLVIVEDYVIDADGIGVPGLAHNPSTRGRIEAIVHCVNNHAKLVRAVKRLTRFACDCRCDNATNVIRCGMRAIAAAGEAIP